MRARDTRVDAAVARAVHRYRAWRRQQGDVHHDYDVVVLIGGDAEGAPEVWTGGVIDRHHHRAMEMWKRGRLES